VISPHPWNPIFLLKHLIGWGRDMPPVHHLSPRRLVARVRQQGLLLIRIRALPYVPWPVLGPLFARLPTTRLFGPRSSLTGTLHGAFAAGFGPG
jgi:hypothetical protein